MRGRITQRRLLRVNRELERLRREEELTAGELEMHRHIDDDAQRDAAVHGTPADRADAYRTERDVSRFRRALEDIRHRRRRLEARRDRLLDKLGGG